MTCLISTQGCFDVDLAHKLIMTTRQENYRLIRLPETARSLKILTEIFHSFDKDISAFTGSNYR